MPTPHFAFRLPASDAAKLRELASLFYDGAPEMASRFVREMIQAITSGDHSKVVAFLTRLQAKMVGQLALDLVAATEGPKGAAKPPLKRKPKGGSHGRATR